MAATISRRNASVASSAPSSWRRNSTLSTPRRAAAARCSASRVALNANVERPVSSLPLSPLVQIRYATRAPARVQRAIVPPEVNSGSSGCAITTRTRSGRIGCIVRSMGDVCQAAAHGPARVLPFYSGWYHSCKERARRPTEAAVVLSDRSIREAIASGRLGLEPFDPAALQPASVDLRLGREFRVFRNWRYSYIDPREPQPDLTEVVEIADDEPFILHPGEFVLARTEEVVTLPDDLVGRVEGKSSNGRLGLLVHATAGYVDPGFSGTLTLELSNVANLPIRLYRGMKIGQIAFEQVSTPVERPYGSAGLGSKYQGQRLPTASRAFQDYVTLRETHS